MSSDTLAVTSVEQDGRVLSGVNVSADDLQKVVDRFAPDEPAQPAKTDAPAAAAPVAEPVKPSRGQKRFDELTAEREAAKRDAEAAAKERDALKAELDALRRPAQQPQAQPVAQPAQEPPKAPELPAHLKNYDAYLAQHPEADYESYRDARDDWRRDQIAAPQFDARIRARIEADRASRSFQEQVEQTRATAREVFPDFDAVISKGPGAMVTMANDRLEAIIRHPQSHHLQYVIAQDAALATKLANCSPFDFGAELARLTPSTSVASPASTGAVGSVPPPAPYQPVGSGSKTTVPSSAELAGNGYDFDKSGYRERRAAERGVTRRR